MASQNDVMDKLIAAGMPVFEAISESARMIEDAKAQPEITLKYYVRRTGKAVAIRFGKVKNGSKYVPN